MKSKAVSVEGVRGMAATEVPELTLTLRARRPSILHRQETLSTGIDERRRRSRLFKTASRRDRAAL